MWRFARLLLAVLAPLFVALAVSSPVHAAWIKDGVLLSALPAAQNVHGAASDGAGGMVIVYQDQSPGSADYNILAQRVDGNGNALWTTNGVVVCNAGNSQWWPRVATLLAAGPGQQR